MSSSRWEMWKVGCALLAVCVACPVLAQAVDPLVPNVSARRQPKLAVEMVAERGQEKLTKIAVNRGDMVRLVATMTMKDGGLFNITPLKSTIERDDVGLKEHEAGLRAISAVYGASDVVFVSGTGAKIEAVPQMESLRVVWTRGLRISSKSKPAHLFTSTAPDMADGYIVEGGAGTLTITFTVHIQ